MAVSTLSLSRSQSTTLTKLLALVKCFSHQSKATVSTPVSCIGTGTGSRIIEPLTLTLKQSQPSVSSFTRNRREKEHEDGHRSSHSSSSGFEFKAKISKSWSFLTVALTGAAAGLETWRRYHNNGTNNLSDSFTLPFTPWPYTVSAAEETCNVGEFKQGLPLYTMEEISKHVCKETGIWVTYKQGVYDITEYAQLHPAGKIILMAAGKSLEPFWNKYTVHNNEVVFEMLEYFRIGNVSGSVQQVSNNNKKLDSDEVQSWMLPEKKLIDFNLNSNSSQPSRSFSLSNLEKEFKKNSVTMAIKCSSGKERREMKWSGVTLGDMMRAQGVDLDKVECKHVVFESLQTRPDGVPYEKRFPVQMVRSMKDDILIAYEVNDEPIPPLQGHPFRVIIKGQGGGKQVKWLRSIRLSTKDEDSSES